MPVSNFLKYFFSLGCIFLSLAALAQPTFTIQNKRDACDGLDNGSFEILVSAAVTPPLRAFVFGPPDQGPYNLSIGTPFTISGLQGTVGGKSYIVIVQDANGSSFSFVTIFAIGSINASITSSTNNTDCISPNGAIDIDVTGGTGSFTYQWTGPAGFVDPGTQDLSGVAGGSYNVAILDNGTNCTRALGPIVITDPSPLVQNVTPLSGTITVCPVDDAVIGLDDTELFVPVTFPIQYQILNNGSPTGFFTNGTGGAISLTLPSGNFVNGDVLTVEAINGLCTPVLMNGSVAVTIQNLAISNVSTPNTKCIAPFNGAIDITVTGAVGTLNYAWTGPGGPYSTEDLTVLQNGAYTVTVTDNTTGCQGTAVINVADARPILNLTNTVTHNSRCVAPFNGAIDLTVAGSAGPFTYAWTGPGGPFTTQDLTLLQNGSYSVTVTDTPTGCTATANINVNNIAPTLTLTNAVTDNSRCVAPFNGAIDLTVAGSAGPFTYAWTGPGGPFTTQDLTLLQNGSYSVTVTDTPTGCTATANINVNNIAPTLTLTNAVTDNSRCVAPFNGAIDLTVAGSAGPFTYAWTGPGGPFTTQDLTLLQNGSYSVTVTDTPTGCTATANINVNNIAPALTLTNAVTDNSRCVAPFNGAIDLTVAGSAGPFTYAWTGPGGPFTTQDLTLLQNGSYSVTVTDTPTGCTATANINVNNIAPTLTLTNAVTDNSRCVAPFNGAIDLTVAGSAGPFTYAWTGPGGPFTTQDLTLLQNGSYSVTVTDTPTGCTATANINVNNIAPTLTLTNAVTDNSRCVAPFNGAIDLTVAGSAGPFTYAWTGPGGPFTTQDLTLLQNGSYSVTVTDTPTGCTATANINVNNIAPALTLTNAVTDNSRCVAPFNGAIDLTVAGSAGPFTYAWTGPGGPFVTEDLTLLQNGSYSVTVTDTPTGCTATANINVNNIAPTLTLTNAVTDNSRCVAPFNGAIDLTVAGSAGPFTYAWTGPGGPFITEDLTALQNGSYTVIVTDTPTGCTATANINVNNITPSLTLTSVVTDNSNCIPFNGAIDLTVAGSVGPFTYAWTGPSGFTNSSEDINNLEPGNYDITVTDNTSGCTVSATITVNDISPVLSVTSLITDNTRCTSPFDGAIDITVAGSAGPFTFDWIGPNGFTSSSEDIAALESGDYDLTLTDNASGCTVLTTISVNDNVPALSIGSVITDNTRCVSTFNGAIDITVAGSAGPFTYTWTGPGGFTSSSEDITNLESGDYNIDVTDNTSGCTASALITVGDLTVFPSVSSTVVDNDQCNAPFNGAILLDITPVGVYSFSWTGPGGFTSSSEDIINLASGAYQVTVTDIVSGCSTIENIVVNDNSTPVTVTADVIVDNSSCTAPFNGVILITATPAGTYTYSWTGPGGFTSSSEDISALRDGDYTVTATNTTLGCSTVQLFTVGDNTVTINITSQTIVDNSSCQTPFNGSISITAGGTVGPYQFDWTGPGGFTGSGASISALQSGDYDVTITDLTIGCTDVYTLTVGDTSPPITLILDSTTPNTNCLAPFTGSLSITASGTAGPYTFSWTGPNAFTSSAEDIVALENGDYDITVTDSGLGCVASATFTVGDSRPTVTLSTVSVTDNTSCVAPFNGVLTVSGGGTAGPFTFNWTGPSGFIGTGASNSSLEPGNYSITAVDQILGCQTTSVIAVPDLAPVILAAPVIIGNSSCLAPFDGSIDITVAGTPGPFTFAWTGPNSFASASEDIAGLEAGNYDVLISDTNLGCSGLFTFTVPQNATTVSIVLQSNTPNSNCSAPFNGALDVTIGGTPGPFTISWTGPGTFTASTEDISNLAPGNYTISVTDDVLGCTANTSFTVASTATGCGGLNCFAYTITIDPALTQRPSCSNQNDGIITLNISGSVPGNYLIALLSGGVPVQPPQLGPSGVYQFPNLSPGSYEYSVLDQAGNLCVQPFNLPVETTVDATAAGFVNAACYGEATGQATITVNSGGASPYVYSIDNGVNWIPFTAPFTITDLPPNGTYSILVADDATDQCPDEVSVTISNTNPAITSTFSVTDAGCNVNNGEIDITSTIGGTGGAYSFRLDGGAVTTTLPFTNLAGGNHIITMIDNSGCERDTTIAVSFPGFVSTTLLSSSPGDCVTGGSISFGINSPGSTIYDIGFTTDFFNEPTNYSSAFYTPPPDPLDPLAVGSVLIPNLPRGDYYIWVTSASAQCPTRINAIPVSITGPYEVNFEFTCRGEDGSLTLTNIAGAAGIGYTYEILQNGFSFFGTITSAESLFDFITAPLAVPLDSTLSYKIRLIQDQTSVSGCVISTAFVDVPAGSLDALAITKEVSFPDQPTGSIRITIQESGVEPYEVWVVDNTTLISTDTLIAVRNPVIFEANFNTLDAGTYSVYLEDARGCRREFQEEILLDENIFIPNVFTPDNDPQHLNEVFYIRNLPPSGSKLSITNRWGKEVFSSNNYNPDNLWDGGDSPDGVYYYRLQIKDGDTYTGWVEIMRGVKP